MTIATLVAREGAEEISSARISAPYPLVLDLDGSLLRTDLLFESALQLLRRNPLHIILLLCWLTRGVAHLKHRLAERADVAIDLLPINERLVAYARQASDTGRRIVVATAANHHLAKRVCARFGFVDEILASHERLNLKGRRKAEALAARFPEGFAYAGDAASDLHVWQRAQFGIFCGRSRALLGRARRVTALEAEFAHARAGLHDWLRALRVHQWVKNALLFLPLLLAGKVFDASTWIACTLGFLGLGFTASGTYLINDLFDLQDDRRHWSKRNRPLSSGTIGIAEGAVASVTLVIAGFLLGALAGGITAVALLGLYCVMTLAYSLYLKRVPLLDVTVLASLFTFRMLFGASLADVPLSAWLAVLSMFLFFSLALAKRATEIGRHSHRGAAETSMNGRGYVSADAALVLATGTASSVAAVVIMVLYLIHEAFSNNLYSRPELLWAAPLLLGLWLGRVWLLCGRGTLNDDPVYFAVRDRVSLSLGLGVMASFGAAVLLG